MSGSVILDRSAEVLEVDAVRVHPLPLSLSLNPLLGVLGECARADSSHRRNT